MQVQGLHKSITSFSEKKKRLQGHPYRTFQQCAPKCHVEHGAWNTSSAGVFAVPFCPRVKNDPKVATNCIAGAGVSRSRRLVMEIVARKAGGREGHHCLWFPSTVELRNDPQQNGLLLHLPLPLRRCQRQRDTSTTSLGGNRGERAARRCVPGTPSRCRKTPVFRLTRGTGAAAS